MAAVTDALKSLSSGCSAQVLCTRTLAHVLFSPDLRAYSPEHACRLAPTSSSLRPTPLLLQPLTAREPAQMYPDPTQTHFRSVSCACTCGCFSVRWTCTCTHARIRMHAHARQFLCSCICANAQAGTQRYNAKVARHFYCGCKFLVLSLKNSLPLSLSPCSVAL